MSFYGLVLIMTVLVISFYLPAFLREINSITSISTAYAATAEAILELTHLTLTAG